MAGLLSGVQGEVPPGGADHPEMQGLRKGFYLFVRCSALAEILSGVSTQVEMQKLKQYQKLQ